MPEKKESLSNFDIHILVREYQKFKNGFLQKLYQPERDSLLLRLYSKEAGKGNLFFKLGKYLCLRKELPENPKQPSQFIVQARKMLNNAIIRDIRQQYFDRVVVFELEKKRRRFLLIFEMFGAGNVILVDKDTNTIIRPLIQRSWKGRILKPKEVYHFPPAQPDLPNLDYHHFREILLSSSRDLVRTLTLSLKMEGNLSEEIIQRTELKKEMEAKSLSEEKIKSLFKTLQAILKSVDEDVGNLQPAVVYKVEEGKETRAFDIIPFPYKIYSSSSFKVVKKEDFNGCVAALFPLSSNTTEEKVKKTEREKEKSPLLQKAYKKAEVQQKAIQSLEKEIKRLKEEVEQIYLNYRKYEILLEEIKRNVELKGGEKFKEKVKEGKVKFIKSVDLKEGKLKVRFPEDKHWLTLCWKETLNQNAQRYYTEIKRLKKKKAGAERALQMSIKEIEELKKRMATKEEETVERKEKERRHFWFEKYRWFLSSDGNLVVAGRDAKTNEMVVKKHLREGDRYVHADYHGAASVVVKKKEDEEEIKESTLEEAAVFAVSFSRAWNAKIASVPAYWVKPEQVSKTPNPGEFLAKGAFVIRGKRNYLKAEMKIAVGEIQYKGKKKLVAAPLSAMKKHAKKYVVLQPGDEKKESVAKKLATLFKYSTDYTQRLVPGDSMFVLK